MAHDFMYHGGVAICEGCDHQSRCARLTQPEGYGVKWLCKPCIAEGEQTEGHTVEMWCTDCEHTLPAWDVKTQDAI